MTEIIETKEGLYIRKDYQRLDPSEWTGDEFIHYRMHGYKPNYWRLLVFFFIGVVISLTARWFFGW